jgi:hypothetical protein
LASDDPALADASVLFQQPRQQAAGLARKMTKNQGD